MIRVIGRLARDERGQTLALMAVIIAGVMSVLALSVDLGMLFKAHGEAQRSADAAALAGAREFMLHTPAASAATPARDSAMAFATRNGILNVAIDTSEVTINVDITNQRVWVRIERQNIGMFFARLLGRNIAKVNAAAAAEAAEAGTATCIAPFAVPDIWGEPLATNGGDDANNNGLWDYNEAWTYGDDAGEVYHGYGTGVIPETGYGSTYRNRLTPGIVNDLGRTLILKVQDPQTAPVSGFFYPFRIGSNTGANDYRNAIENCDNQVVPLNSNVPLEMGNMVGPTRQGVTNLIAQDPGSHWDTSTNTYVGSSAYPGYTSPRLKIVPLYDPYWITQVVGGNHNLVFNNFAVVFIEGIQKIGKDEWLQGRFMYYASGLGGSAPGGATGSLVRVLRLVE
jgi:Putative Flp pilus-assembly TadE/G-like